MDETSVFRILWEKLEFFLCPENASFGDGQIVLSFTQWNI